MMTEPKCVDAQAVISLAESLSLLDRIGPLAWSGCCVWFDREGKPVHRPGIRRVGCLELMPAKGIGKGPYLDWRWSDKTTGCDLPIVMEVESVTVEGTDLVVSGWNRDDASGYYRIAWRCPITGPVPDLSVYTMAKTDRPKDKPKARQSTLEAWA